MRWQRFIDLAHERRPARHRGGRAGGTRIVVRALKLFPITPVAHTLFALSRYVEELASEGIVLTDDHREAHVFLTNRFPFGRREVLRFKLRYGLFKPIFVWTHEPRFCTLVQPEYAGNLLYPRTFVMDVYTRDVYLSNLTHFGWAASGHLEPLTKDPRRPSASAPIVALATYRPDHANWQLVIGGEDIDLTVRREILTLEGHRRGLIDVFGPHWPPGVAIENSRDGDWHERKQEILRDYTLNICMENTAFAYFCTEKIWDSIAGGCLPIYWARGTCIHDDFPQGSLVAYDDFAGPDELLDYLRDMSAPEYIRRMNACIDVFNRVAARDFEAERRCSFVLLRDRLRALRSEVLS